MKRDSRCDSENLKNVWVGAQNKNKKNNIKNSHVIIKNTFYFTVSSDNFIRITHDDMISPYELYHYNEKKKTVIKLLHFTRQDFNIAALISSFFSQQYHVIVSSILYLKIFSFVKHIYEHTQFTYS